MTRVPIPQPRRLPVLGNALAVDPVNTVQSMMALARRLGPVFRLQFPGHDIVLVSSAAMIAELSDGSRFEKTVHGPLQHIRDLAGDGLFTAYNSEPNWALAHRILRSSFGPTAMGDYHAMMLDLAEQLVLKWERFGPEHEIDVSADMTRLAIDTISLCAFGYRMNSFYRDDLHPFVRAIRRYLTEAGARTKRPPFLNRLFRRKAREYREDIAFMHSFVDGVIRARREAAEGGARGLPQDLLARMLEGRDPETGERLDEENIRYQVITFFIAGHETSGGLLSFALHELLRAPEALLRARAEVDEVLGGDRTVLPTMQDVARFGYLEQVLLEALRKWPTAAAYGVRALKDEVIGGRYAVRPDQELLVLLPNLHRDPAAWGDDAEVFRPERFGPGERERIPDGAYKPFGNGMRACIGQFFAIHEAKTALALILHRFDLVDVAPERPLEIHETITIKPRDFRVRATRRESVAGGARRGAVGAGDGGGGGAGADGAGPVRADDAVAAGSGGADAGGAKGCPFAGRAMRDSGRIRGRFRVLYGSKMGSAEKFAGELARDLREAGADVGLGPLNDAVATLSSEDTCLVITASYDGQPPANARAFCEWLDSAEAPDLASMPYAVFGCGHSHWKNTFQSVPTRVDEALSRRGGRRLLARGSGDAAGEMAAEFARWKSALLLSLAAAQ